MAGGAKARLGSFTIGSGALEKELSSADSAASATDAGILLHDRWTVRQI